MGKRIMKPTLAAAAVALAIAGFPASAQAAGLGRLTVLSGLGQPLHAEVELSAVRDELSSAAVRMAAPEAFRQAGIEYATVLSTVKMALAQRRDGKPVIRITTERPVDDPFLAILVELNWASGRLVREYTFLLDPPDMPVARQAAAPVVAPVAAPAVTQVVTGRPVAAAPSPAAAKAAETTHEVRRGETLHGIATETKPEGVTLDQMLVAIFRANPQAFDGNMSRLRAGRILNLPERDAVAAVAAPEARRIVLAQAAQFNAYRRKLSQAVAAAPAPKEAPARQAAAGRLAPRVEEKPAAPAEAVDQLKVSKAEAAGKAAGAQTATVDRAAQARITALEEDLVAKEKSLKDANGRLAELEKSVRELQQLLELKNQNLAQLQGKPGTPQAAAPAKAPEPAPAAQAPQPAAPAPAPAAQKPELPEPAAPPVPQREEAGFLSGLFGGPLGWALGAVVVALLGFFGYRARKQRAEPGAPVTAGATTAPVAQASFGAAGGQSVDTASSSIQTDFSQSGLSSIDTDEGVDPVAEADVYMAYGRDAQAEEILLDALKSEPARHAIHVKLLEIYAQRKDVKRFDALATELYAATGGKGPEWDKAAAMGRKLDPTNPLFGAGAAAPAEETRFTEKTIVVSSPDKLRDTWTMPGDAGQIAAAVSGDREDKTVILERSPLAEAGAAPLGLAVEPAAKAGPAPVSDVDFDLGLDFSTTLTTPRPAEALAAEKTVVLEPGARAGGKPSIDLPLEAATTTQQRASPIDLDLEPGAARPQAHGASLDLEATDIGGNLIDFDLDQSSVKSAPAAQVIDLEKTDIGADVMQFVEGERAGAGAAPVVDLEKTDFGGGVLDFDFKLDEAQNASPAGQPAAPAAPPLDLSGINLDLSAPPAEEGAEEISEVATKIELAKAYEEMGDKEGARELLDEVLKEGNASEQQRAREMLSRLG